MLPQSAILVLFVSAFTFADVAPKRALSPGQVLPLVKHGKYNYFVGTTFKATQLQALRFCRNINMTLLDIESEAENEAVYKFIKDKNEGDNYWSSGSRIIDGKSWLWLSTGKEIEYTNWDNGEPNTNDDYCLSLRIDNRNKVFWRDDGCGAEKPFICKAAADENENRQSKVWSNIFERTKGLISDEFVYGDKYYYFARQFKGSFAQGFQFCDTIGMVPVSITSQDENDRIYKHLRDTNAENNWWSSGARSTDTVHWFWLSNGQLVNYTNWAISEPNNRLSEQCLALVFNKDKGLYFFDVGCHVTHPVVCERPVKQSKLSKRETQKPWLKRAQAVKKQNTLGKYYIEQDFEATHDEAVEYCKFLDMQLSEINSLQKIDRITRELILVADKGPFHISGKRSKADWVFDSNNQKMEYTNWQPGKPEEALKYGCIRMSDQGKWVDVNCDKKSLFICEQPGADADLGDDCPQPVINVYINNNMPALEHQTFIPIRVDDKSAGDEHSVLVQNKWDTCSN
ncbi:macrophage mannose receptor 1-like [Diabrotica undecimpunctata]|uniref:macrophage mannose receptor 1-like n=1 Tax=Diabrotica undecimpunctata TaxID=50387 RepID=UPI003B637469